MSVLAFDLVCVDREYVEAVVRTTDPVLAHTSKVPDLAERALGLLPGLRRHSCENGSAHGFAAELGATEAAHLLEHLAAELMALSGSPRTLKGETTWDFSADGAGVYRVRLAYDSDLVALGSLKAAAGIVDWLFAGETSDASTVESEPPDVDALVETLRRLR